MGFTIQCSRSQRRRTKRREGKAEACVHCGSARSTILINNPSARQISKGFWGQLMTKDSTVYVPQCSSGFPDRAAG